MAPRPNVTIDELTAFVAGQTVPRRFVETAQQHPDRVALRNMVGEAPGSKVEKARALGITALDEAAFQHLIMPT